MMKKSEKTFLKNYWIEHYIDKETGLCSLCGNTGIVNTQPKSPLGRLLKEQTNFCVCPNGVEMRGTEEIK